jgi:hypothetical protein
MREMTLPDYLYRCSRWLLKEVPDTFLTAMRPPFESTSAIDRIVDRLIDTPIDLLCRRVRAQGQHQAKLPDIARQIAWLPSSSSIS